jgi:AraC-like DNA-binding protein
MVRKSAVSATRTTVILRALHGAFDLTFTNARITTRARSIVLRHYGTMQSMVDLFNLRRCSLPQVHAVEARSTRAFARHSHDSYGIGLILRGAQRSWSGRGSVEAGRGNLITCNPGEVHDGSPIGGSREWKMLYFSPSLFTSFIADVTDRYATEFEFTEPVIGRRIDRIRRFELLYDALTCGADRLAEERALLFVAGLISCRTPRNILSAEITRAKTRIDDDPTAALDLELLASEANMSRFQLIRHFSKQTGFTPYAYVVQRRLDIAREMLARRQRLTDAAITSGFADQSHFNRTFTRRYGMTPGAYAAAFR